MNKSSHFFHAFYHGRASKKLFKHLPYASFSNIVLEQGKCYGIFINKRGPPSVHSFSNSFLGLRYLYDNKIVNFRPMAVLDTYFSYKDVCDSILCSTIAQRQAKLFLFTWSLQYYLLERKSQHCIYSIRYRFASEHLHVHGHNWHSHTVNNLKIFVLEGSYALFKSAINI